MYVSLFPQLVAGPIVRYSTIAAESDNRKVTAEDWREGLSRIIFGLSKKVIIANSLSTVVGEVFGGDIKTVSVVGTWYGATLFALQVYFDFSGYSDMAIGLGRLFGFHFNENFNYPFIAKDIQEFWQRWHISLGSFFRDYLLYIPIFGKRRKYGGLFLVWFCTGLWHGASWNFVFWGLYFGLFILIETLVGKKKIKKLPVYVRHLYTKIVLIIGFGIFYFEDTKRLGNFFKNLIGLNHNSFSDHVISVSFANNIWLISLAILLSMPVWKNIKTRLNNYNSKSNNIPALYALNIAETTFLVLLLFTSSVLLVGATNNAFLYYRF
jgi:alginate O-acetyltransferase complex protein AlgI